MHLWRQTMCGFKTHFFPAVKLERYLPWVHLFHLPPPNTYSAIKEHVCTEFTASLFICSCVWDDFMRSVSPNLPKYPTNERRNGGMGRNSHIWWSCFGCLRLFTDQKALVGALLCRAHKFYPFLFLLKACFNILLILHIYQQWSSIFFFIFPWKPFHPVHTERITLRS